MGYVNDACIVTVRVGVLIYIGQEQVLASVSVLLFTLLTTVLSFLCLGLFFFQELWHPVTKDSSSYSCETIISNHKCRVFYCSATCCNKGRWQAFECSEISVNDSENRRKCGCIPVIFNFNLFFTELVTFVFMISSFLNVSF